MQALYWHGFGILPVMPNWAQTESQVFQFSQVTETSMHFTRFVYHKETLYGPVLPWPWSTAHWRHTRSLSVWRLQPFSTDKGVDIENHIFWKSCQQQAKTGSIGTFVLFGWCDSCDCSATIHGIIIVKSALYQSIKKCAYTTHLPAVKNSCLRIHSSTHTYIHRRKYLKYYVILTLLIKLDNANVNVIELSITLISGKTNILSRLWSLPPNMYTVCLEIVLPSQSICFWPCVIAHHKIFT